MPVKGIKGWNIIDRMKYNNVSGVSIAVLKIIKLLGQKVMVTIVEVDIPRKRIALSLKESGVERQEAVKKAFKNELPVQKEHVPSNLFQAKLMELKKNFKD